MQTMDLNTYRLQQNWRAIVKASGKNLRPAQTAVRFASSTGLRPSSAKWLAAAIWKYNQR